MYQPDIIFRTQYSTDSEVEEVLSKATCKEDVEALRWANGERNWGDLKKKFSKANYLLPKYEVLILKITQ